MIERPVRRGAVLHHRLGGGEILGALEDDDVRAAEDHRAAHRPLRHQRVAELLRDLRCRTQRDRIRRRVARHHRDLAGEEEALVLHAGVRQRRLRRGTVAHEDVVDPLQRRDRPRIIELGLRVLRVVGSLVEGRAAVRPAEGHEAVRDVARVELGDEAVAGLAGLVFDLLGEGLHLGPGLRGRLGVEACALEELLVPDEAVRLVVRGDAVELALPADRLERAGPEVVRLVAQLREVDLRERAARRELRPPEERQHRHVRPLPRPQRDAELVQHVVVGELLLLELDAWQDGLELRDPLLMVLRARQFGVVVGRLPVAHAARGRRVRRVRRDGDERRDPGGRAGARGRGAARRAGRDHLPARATGQRRARPGGGRPRPARGGRARGGATGRQEGCHRRSCGEFQDTREAAQ